MELTEKEKNFIARYKNLTFSYTMSFIFIAFVILIQVYIMLAKIIPTYTRLLHDSPKIQNAVKWGLYECMGMSLLWCSFLVGSIIGEFINHLKIKRIFNKLKT